ncbi:helix-turn-helix domain-containing protein [Peribacillus loiseleuriae]|uniref:helix-turn-helix domain-containing protein n=1 Tax=Peribacillus loiseleuriae TaxID=1679170 RepID=UPI003D015640
MFDLTELGNRLKEAREEKGLSLDDLQEVTKIQKRYLVGIEEGNYSMMPGQFYVRAFIKQYCEAVELEPEEIFDQYKNEVPAIYYDELPELSRVQSRRTLSPTTSKAMELFPKILGLLFFVGIIVLLYFLYLKFTPNEKPNVVDDSTGVVDHGQPDNSPLNKGSNTDVNENKSTDKTDKSKDDVPVKEEVVEEVAPTQELAVISTSGSNSTYALKNAATFKLKVASTGEAWIKVKNGSGQTLFNGLIKSGEAKEIDATNESEVVIRTGRAYETEIFANDQKVEYAISPTEKDVQNVTIQFTKAE